ncbi:MAG TPA: xanthine dehydrogenase family protein subunit M [Solirubrobacteraceae bacterium]|jgi:carbon-monoxide dehydrogenase medium subunit|nr:xanthine dehydrogenase family protein subunit M [Solirubrobacteraceae bacterium]
MKPSRFAYHDPTILEEALVLLREHGDEAKVLAGGQSLMPMLSMRLAYPSVLIDLNRLYELDGIRDHGDEIVFGALTRHADAEDSAVVAAACPLLTRALPWVAHRSVRNRGTLGGSLAHADPAAEIPAVMTALDASVVAHSASGPRHIPIAELFDMPLVSTLAADEILTEIRVPRQPAGSVCAVAEAARRHGDFALAGVVATALVDDGGALDDVRLVSFATGPVPQRLSATEAMLTGIRPDGAVLAQAGRLASEEVDPGDDLHATSEYRRVVTAALVERALGKTLTSAGHPPAGSDGIADG